MIDEDEHQTEIESNEAEFLEPEKVEAKEEAPEPVELSNDESQLLSDGGLADAPSEEETLKLKYKELKRKVEKERRQLYSQAHQNKLLQQELEAANERARLASEAANFHYASVADGQIAAAEQKLRIAEENGDMDMKIEATKDLQRAIIQKTKSDDYQYQTRMQNEAQQQEAPQQEFIVNPYELNRESVNDWVEDNSQWLNPNSPRYDHGMVSAIDTYVANWNDSLEQAGLREQIGTPEYFRVLNQKISEAQSRRQPQMKQVQRAGAPVRGVSRNNPQTASPKLSRDAQEMMNGLRNYGIKVKDEDLIKHLKKGAEHKAMWGR